MFKQELSSLLRLLLATLAVAPTAIANAATLEQHLGNLLYFTYAERAASHCQQSGVEARQSLERWMGQHIQVRVAAIEALRAAARAAGQDLAGEELSIASAAAIHGRQVDDLIAERGVPCKTFSAWLDRVAELLSR